MKKLFQTLCLSILPALAFGHSHAQYLGLVSELTHIKMYSENLALSLLNDSNNSDEFKSRVVESYNELRMLDDQFILQLTADSRTKKGLCAYRKLDKMLTCKSIAEIKKEYYDKDHHYHSEKLESYVWNLIMLNKAHNKFAKLKEEAYSKGYMACYTGSEGNKKADVMMYAAVNDISSNRERKVERVTMMLEDLRLCPVQKLIKKEKVVKKDKVVKMEHTVKFDKAYSGMIGNGGQVVRIHKKHTKTCKCK